MTCRRKVSEARTSETASGLSKRENFDDASDIGSTVSLLAARFLPE